MFATSCLPPFSAFLLSYWIYLDSEGKAQLFLLMNIYVTFLTVKVLMILGHAGVTENQ